MQQSENLKLHLFVDDKFDSENHYKQKLNKKFDKLLRIETEWVSEFGVTTSTWEAIILWINKIMYCVIESSVNLIE